MSQPAGSSNLEQQPDKATYQVVLNGVQPNAIAAEAKDKLATLFKATPEQIANILATPEYVVKKGISLEVASKYKSAIEAAGGACDLIPEGTPVALDIELPTAEPVASVAAKAADVKTVLFEGDASLLKSAISIVQGQAVGTTHKFVFSGGGKDSITLRKADILSATEVKHGFTTKWVVKTHAGQTYTFLASNVKALRLTMLTLTGQDTALGTKDIQPELSAVRNGTAWLAAFGPTLSGLITWIVLVVLNGGMPDSWSGSAMVKIAFFKLVLIYFFLRIDSLRLQQQGFNTVKLGIARPEQFPLYLFSRAKAFHQGKAYAIVWCVSFGLEALLFIAGMLGD